MTNETIRVGPPPQPVRYKFPTRPLPKERPQFIARNGKVVAKTSDRTEAYEDAVAQYAALQHPVCGPYEGDLTVFMTFHFASRVHGDLDNLCKSILDAVQERTVYRKRKRQTLPGIVMRNDKQVKALHLQVVYKKGQQEFTEMIVDRFNDQGDLDDAGAEFE